MKTEVDYVKQNHQPHQLKSSFTQSKKGTKVICYLRVLAAASLTLYQLVPPPAAAQIFGNVPPGGRQRGGILGGHLHQDDDDEDHARPNIFAQAGGRGRPPPILGGGQQPQRRPFLHGRPLGQGPPIVGPDGDRSSKIRLGPIVISPESLDYDDAGGGGGVEDFGRDDRILKPGNGPSGVDVFNKIFVSLKNFLLFMGKVSSSVYKQVGGKTTHPADMGDFRDSFDNGDSPPPPPPSSEGQTALLVIVLTSWLMFAVIVALVGWSVYRSWDDPVTDDTATVSSKKDGNRDLQLKADSKTPSRSGPRQFPQQQRRLWKLTIPGTVSLNQSRLLRNRMRLPHGRNAEGKCDKKLDVEVIDESTCCSCCLMADMQVNEQAAGAVISLTEVLNHPNVTRVVRNQWLQALNNAAKPSANDNAEGFSIEADNSVVQISDVTVYDVHAGNDFKKMVVQFSSKISPVILTFPSEIVEIESLAFRFQSDILCKLNSCCQTAAGFCPWLQRQQLQPDDGFHSSSSINRSSPLTRDTSPRRYRISLFGLTSTTSCSLRDEDEASDDEDEIEFRTDSDEYYTHWSREFFSEFKSTDRVIADDVLFHASVTNYQPQAKCDNSTDDCSTHDDDDSPEDSEGLSSIRVRVDSLTLTSACRCIDPGGSCTCNNAALKDGHQVNSSLELRLETDVPTRQTATLPKADTVTNTSCGVPFTDVKEFGWTSCPDPVTLSISPRKTKEILVEASLPVGGSTTKYYSAICASNLMSIRTQTLTVPLAPDFLLAPSPKRRRTMDHGNLVEAGEDCQNDFNPVVGITATIKFEYLPSAKTSVVASSALPLTPPPLTTVHKDLVTKLSTGSDGNHMVTVTTYKLQKTAAEADESALTTGDEENGKGDGDVDPGYSTGIDVALAATRDLQIAMTSKDPTRSQPANLATMRSVMVIRSSQKFPKMGHRLSLTSSKNSLTTTTTNSVDVKAESRRSNSSSKDDPEIVAAMARPQRRHRRHQSTALVSNAGPGSGGGVGGGRVITKGSASLPPPSPVKGGRGAAVRGGAKRFLSGIVSASHSCTPQKMLMKSKKRSRSISPKAKNSTKKKVPRKYRQKITNQLKKLHKSTGDLTRHDHVPAAILDEKAACFEDADGDSGAGDCSKSSCSSGQSWELASWRGDLSMSWQSLGSLSSFLVSAPTAEVTEDHDPPPPHPYERQQSSPVGSDGTSGSEVSGASSSGRLSLSTSTHSTGGGGGGGIVALSNAGRSSKTRRPTLVLETLEYGITRHYLMPRGVTRRRQLKRKGEKLRIFSGHVFESKKVSGGQQATTTTASASTKAAPECCVCQRKIVSSRLGRRKRMLRCRGCNAACHKHCHTDIDYPCPQSIVSKMELYRGSTILKKSRK